MDYPILHKLSKKVALATGLVTHFASSVTKYQVTNYGLGGTCETHIDPYGYLEGFKLTDVNSHLVETGPKTFCALLFFPALSSVFDSLGTVIWTINHTRLKSARME